MKYAVHPIRNGLLAAIRSFPPFQIQKPIWPFGADTKHFTTLLPFIFSPNLAEKKSRHSTLQGSHSKHPDDVHGLESLDFLSYP